MPEYKRLLIAGSVFGKEFCRLKINRPEKVRKPQVLRKVYMAGFDRRCSIYGITGALIVLERVDAVPLVRSAHLFKGFGYMTFAIDGRLICRSKKKVLYIEQSEHVAEENEKRTASAVLFYSG